MVTICSPLGFGLLALCVGAALSAQMPPELPADTAAASTDPWIGMFRGDGIALDLEAVADGYSGTLEHAGQRYPVRAQRQQDGALVGAFRVGGDSFAFAAVLRGTTLSLDSDGRSWLLEAQRHRQQNPLGHAPGATLPVLERVFDGPTRRWQHPDGLFACDLPADWSVANATDEAVLINPGLGPNDNLDAIVALAFGPLEDAEQGVTVTTLLDRYEPRLRRELAEQAIELEAATTKARAVALGDRVGAEQMWQGTANERPLTVWLGALVERDAYIVVTAIVVRDAEKGFLPGAKRVFLSLSPIVSDCTAASGGADLTGASFAGGQTLSGGGLHSIYTFAAGGRVKKEILMSGRVGISMDVGGDIVEWGTWQVEGAAVSLTFADSEESARLVVEAGQVAALRFGNAIYHRR